MHADVRGFAHRGRRWAARAALAATALAVLLPAGYGGVAGALLIVAGVAGCAVTAAAVWWTLSRRGPTRMAAGVLVLAVPALLIFLFVVTFRWMLVVSLALWALALAAGRHALREEGERVRRPKERHAPPPARPVLIMNPRSGGGKVERFDLRDKAEALGARVVLLDSGGHQDVTALARDAVASGADLLGVAGGDGTQALVAAVAAEHGIPFLVIPAGTRNHFAMDLGLDRDDPVSALGALADGVELRVDLGFAADRPFVNNASFGTYAMVVQNPSYRADKFGTALGMLPDLLTRHLGPRLLARVRGTTLTSPHTVLISNNPYRTTDTLNVGRRNRLDSGRLGVLSLSVDSAAEAAALLLNPTSNGIAQLTSRKVVIDSDRAEVEVGLDGEALRLPTPVLCRIAPRALRVRVPRDRPGVPAERPRLDWRRLRRLAAAVGRAAAPGHRMPP